MSVRDKINNGDYETKLPYPVKPRKGVAPVTLAAASTEQLQDALAKKTDRDAAMVAYEANRKAYYEDLSRLEQEFRRDLEAEFGMTNHPKRDLLYQKAYDHGHSGGYSEILYWYADLAELLT